MKWFHILRLHHISETTGSKSKTIRHE
jgi:hypothetical protein